MSGAFMNIGLPQCLFSLRDQRKYYYMWEVFEKLPTLFSTMGYYNYAYR